MNFLNLESRKQCVFAAVIAAGLLATTSAVAQEELGAVAESVEGEVEVSIDEADWVSLEEGDAVPIESRISTGFDSQAVLAVGESTRVTVEALTRMEIEDLAVEEGVEKSELDLQVGRIEGEVQRSAESPSEFQVRSPVATASVRGTRFTFDGQTLEVTDGEVALTTPTGVERVVAAGEQGSSDGESAPQSPGSERAARATTQTRTSGGERDGTRAPAPELGADDSTTTVIMDFGTIE